MGPRLQLACFLFEGSLWGRSGCGDNSGWQGLESELERPHDWSPELSPVWTCALTHCYTPRPTGSLYDKNIWIEQNGIGI